MVVIIGLVVIAGLVVAVGLVVVITGVVESEYQEGVVAGRLVVVIVAGVVLVSGPQVQEQLGGGLLSTVTDVEAVLVVLAVEVACRRESAVILHLLYSRENQQRYELTKVEMVWAEV